MLSSPLELCLLGRTAIPGLPVSPVCLAWTPGAWQCLARLQGSPSLPRNRLGRGSWVVRQGCWIGYMDVCQHFYQPACIRSYGLPVFFFGPVVPSRASEGRDWSKRERKRKKISRAADPLPLELGSLIGWLAPVTTSSVSLIWEGSWVCRFFFFPSLSSPWLAAPVCYALGAPAD